MVEILLKGGADISLAFPAIHGVAAGGHAELLQILIDSDVDLNLLDDMKRTPLHHAAVKNQLRTSEILLANGSKVNVTDIVEDTPLHLGAIHEEIVGLLVRNGARSDIRNRQGRTALHSASTLINENILTDLLGAGGNINAADLAGNTPLHLAADFKQVPQLMVMEIENSEQLRQDLLSGLSVLLLLRSGADPNALDSFGRTPLHAACESFHVSEVART